MRSHCIFNSSTLNKLSLALYLDPDPAMSLCSVLSLTCFLHGPPWEYMEWSTANYSLCLPTSYLDLHHRTPKLFACSIKIWNPWDSMLLASLSPASWDVLKNLCCCGRLPFLTREDKEETSCTKNKDQWVSNYPLKVKKPLLNRESSEASLISSICSWHQGHDISDFISPNENLDAATGAYMYLRQRIGF